jgi:phosphate:Na+ symporter
MGFNSKVVVTGDVTQIDLPDGKRSGLVEVTRILKNMEQIEIVHFTGKDVVRHKLVQDIIRAYEKYEKAAAERADMDRLEPRFLNHPTLALNQSRTVIDSMASKAGDSVESAISVRKEFSRDGLKKVFDLEGVLDRYEDKLGNYLFKIMEGQLDEQQSEEVSKYMRVLSDFERISDHARNVGEAVEEINEKKIEFSDAAARELETLEDAIGEITRITIKAFIEDDAELALHIDPLEEVIDDLCDDMKSNHIDRVSQKVCTLENGFVFNDLLTDYERISDHCSNVAVDILDSITGTRWKHEFHSNPEFRQDELFKRYFQEYKERFAI